MNFPDPHYMGQESVDLAVAIISSQPGKTQPGAAGLTGGTHRVGGGGGRR